MGAACCAEAKQDLATLVGPPTAALCPPGKCAFSAEWSKATLAERVRITHDVILVTFSLPVQSKPLGLSTCACILAKFDDAHSADGSTQAVVRPYTPVSTNALVGKFQLLVKVYEGGKMSQHLRDMSISDELEFKHIEKNVKIQYPFGRKHVTMIAGGTGITPIVQALHAILGTEGDTTQVTLLFGNKTQKDILGRQLLDNWAKRSKGRLNVVHVLSQALDDPTWAGLKGRITREVIEQHSAPPASDVLVMVCGPPPMYGALCGPREEVALTGTLADMGFKAEQVFKF